MVSQQQEALLARQPIYNRQLTIVAYELLFRSDEHNRALILDPDQASSEVLLNTYSAISLESITGNYPAFVNLSSNLMISPQELPFPPDQIVFEILEDVKVTPSLVKWVQEASALGFRIALDDFEYSPEYDVLLPDVDYVKLDIMHSSKADIEFMVSHLKQFNVTLLAEKIETFDEFHYCKSLGFSLFQGYFLSKPRILKGHKVKTNTQVALQVLQELNDPCTTPERIQTLLTQDAALTFKLLRIVNSAAYGLPRKIETIKEAIIMIGLLQLRSWISLVALSSCSNKPPALLLILFVRAKMCELIAERTQSQNPNSYFTAGLFSGLDAILDIPLSEALQQVPLSDTINDALLQHSGSIGKVLSNVLNYERGDWEHLSLNEDSHRDANLYQTAYLDSIHWGDEITQMLNMQNDNG